MQDSKGCQPPYWEVPKNDGDCEEGERSEDQERMLPQNSCARLTMLPITHLQGFHYRIKLRMVILSCLVCVD